MSLAEASFPVRLVKLVLGIASDSSDRSLTSRQTVTISEDGRSLTPVTFDVDHPYVDTLQVANVARLQVTFDVGPIDAYAPYAIDELSAYP